MIALHSHPPSPRWLLVAGLALAACQEPPTEVRPPKIAFGHTAHDFGTVEQGTKVVHAFTIRNDGGSDLSIDDVRTSCGCTAAITSAKVIPPGGTGTIDTTVDTSRIFGKSARTVTVYANDPAQPVTTLTLSGEITVDVVADPPELYIGRVGRGARARRDVHLVVMDENVAVTGSQIEGRVLSLSIESLDGDPRGRRLAVTIKRDAPLGRFTERATVQTTSARHGTIVVPIVGIVEGDVTVSPPQLAFGQVPKGSTPSQIVIVKNAGAQAIQVRSVHASPRVAHTRVTTVRPGREYHVAIALRDTLPPGRVQGHVDIRTDHPEQPVLTVPFTATVKASK